MKKGATFAAMLLLAACSRPDKVIVFKSPDAGLFYSIEEYHASTPASDTDRVYAHLERDGKSSKVLVLEGGDLTITAIRWDAPGEATLCIDGGITNTFRNQVTLFAGEASITVKNHIDEHCGGAGQSAPMFKEP